MIAEESDQPKHPIVRAIRYVIECGIELVVARFPDYLPEPSDVIGRTNEGKIPVLPEVVEQPIETAEVITG